MCKPHCYGQMDWILKYPEDDIPKSSICDCEYANSCLKLTKNKTENSQIKQEIPIEIEVKWK